MVNWNPGKYVCRICGKPLDNGEFFPFEEALSHLLECHPQILESLAVWLVEEREESGGEEPPGG
ncbi:MAG: hypothetical protein QW692_02020 [Nitrososphaerota archaeon]